MKYHPDKGGEHSTYVEIKKQYEGLVDSFPELNELVFEIIKLGKVGYYEKKLVKTRIMSMRNLSKTDLSELADYLNEPFELICIEYGIK